MDFSDLKVCIVAVSQKNDKSMLYTICNNYPALMSMHIDCMGLVL